MPACGSEGACLRGLCTNNGSSKTGQASPVPPHQHRYPHRKPSLHHHRRPNHLDHHHQAGYLNRITSSVLRLAHRILTCIILAPAIWFSAWICFFWFVLRLPLVLVRLVLQLGSQGAGPAGLTERRQRCVLVSGGSTVQAVQLARSLSQLGEARVIVCDVEGLFGLARFSRCCARYYTLPSPSSGAAAEYVRALADIVKRERVSAYVPVSAGGAAYYDALAKPHLELLGCECLVPGAAEVALLDDPLELLRRTRLLGLARPWHLQLGSLEEAATRFYDQSGRLREPASRFYVLRAGPAGMRPAESSTELRLPGSLAEFARAVNLLDQQQLNSRANSAGWVVLRDPGGPHFLSCASVRDSRLVGSVTCRLDEERNGELVVEERPEVRRWLERFFSRGSGGPLLLAGGAKFSGHLSFRLVGVADRPGEVAAIGCRVGMGLAYLGLDTSEQVARLLWNSSGDSTPCRAITNVLTPTKVIDKKEALFLYWDPLPYCVYCYLQLPFRRLLGLLGPQQSQHKPPLGVVQ